MFREGPIEGVVEWPLQKFGDQRGWLIEIFRNDQIDVDYAPVMSYVSETLPGIMRGPHEHVEQADLFGFLGPSTFQLYLWDNRKSSPTYQNRRSILAGQGRPAAVIIPAGVVHAYKNVGDVPGWVFNCPNRLYRGPHKKEPVDEIRHEERPDTPFVPF